MINKPEVDWTLADHAEFWWKEQGNKVPKRNTPEYEDMYQQWVEFAFDSLKASIRRKGAKR